MQRSMSVSLVAVVLLGTAVAASAAPPPPCPPGRYAVEGFGLLGKGASDVVGFGDGRAWIDSGCAPVLARITGGSRYTRIVATWDSCNGVPGRVRLVARVDAATCGTISGRVTIPKARLKVNFEAAQAPEPSCDDVENTFEEIQNHIFSRRTCTVSTCHGPFAQGNLDLRPGASYLHLVGVPADNPTARAAGKLRVDPGNPSASFLSQKLHGYLTSGEGSPMPLLGGLIPQVERDVIDAWIAAGAPQTGRVPGAPCIPEDEYEATPAPPAPPGGHQLVLEGPWLAPGQEQEGCMWIPAPNASDFDVLRWEIALNPGTHHFAVFDYDRAGVPPNLGVWTPGDVGCISGSDFGDTLTGAPQAPYFVDGYPAGVARRVRGGSYIGLNAHYANVFDVPIQIRAWVGMYPYPGTPDHLGTTIIDIDDMLTGINVPPFTQRIMPGVWYNPTGRSISVFGVSGHMHKRGVRFTAWQADGTKIYENFDWAHPVSRDFEPPLVLGPGERLEYECLHDNGVTRELKTDGLGNPITLRFGVTTDDEMCTINGQYFVN
jgi:hypothetical protein